MLEEPFKENEDESDEKINELWLIVENQIKNGQDGRRLAWLIRWITYQQDAFQNRLTFNQYWEQYLDNRYVSWHGPQ